jgi:DNA polymerase III epsilon subunit family exonuclease
VRREAVMPSPADGGDLAARPRAERPAMSDERRVSVYSDSLEPRYVVIDLETTGLDALGGHEICELAALAVAGGRIKESFGTLVNPGRPIPPDSTAVNGITDEMVTGAPSMPEVIPGFLGFLGIDSVLVVHNAPFDMSFLQTKLVRLGFAHLDNLVVDTLDLAKKEFGPGGNSLGQLARRLDLEQGTPHRALGDTETTARLFLNLQGRCRARGLLTVGSLGARSADYFIPLAVAAEAGPGTQRPLL